MQEKNEIIITFSKNLARLMEIRAINNSKLAKEINVSHVQVKNWLSGQIPRADMLYSLSRFFAIDMETILTGKKLPNEIEHARSDKLKVIKMINSLRDELKSIEEEIKKY